MNNKPDNSLSMKHIVQTNNIKKFKSYFNTYYSLAKEAACSYLEDAAYYNSLDIVVYILTKFRHKISNETINTALKQAAYKNNLDIIKFLIINYKEIITKRSVIYTFEYAKYYYKNIHTIKFIKKRYVPYTILC